MSERFTIDGSPELERHLAEVCLVVRQGVESIVPLHRLEGLLLTGGYGCGEGGVLRSDAGDAAYGELTFVTLGHGGQQLLLRRHSSALRELAERLTTYAGVKVTIQIISLRRLRATVPSIHHHDLITAHRWLIGDESVLRGCGRHRDSACISLHETSRFLFNHCSDLLLAKERLQRTDFTDLDAVFVQAKLAQAQLALGDTWLAMHGAYHWSCRERHQLLAEMTLPAWAQALRLQHAEGVLQKLRPEQVDATMRGRLLQQCDEISKVAQTLWQVLEARRLGKDFTDVGEYALSSSSLCPEQPPLLNAFVNLRSFGTSGLTSVFRGRSPHERLLRSLSLLLWARKDSPAVAAMLAICLGCEGQDFSQSVTAYSELWERFH